jgi:hypothetical protein
MGTWPSALGLHLQSVATKLATIGNISRRAIGCNGM